MFNKLERKQEPRGKTMGKCEYVPTCPFFNDRMQNMPAMAKMLKKKYCYRDSQRCARYIVSKALGIESVPGDLFPNEVDRAKEIVAGS